MGEGPESCLWSPGTSAYPHVPHFLFMVLRVALLMLHNLGFPSTLKEGPTDRQIVRNNPGMTRMQPSLLGLLAKDVLTDCKC